MSYRPQWAWPSDPAYRYEPWAQAIVPSTIAAIPAGSTRGPFVISFDRDADFIVMGVSIDAGRDFLPLGYQFTDAFGYYLSDTFIFNSLYALPLGQAADRGGGYAATFNPGHFVPAGGVWQLSVINYDAGTALSIPPIELRGLKRSKVVCQ